MAKDKNVNNPEVQVSVNLDTTPILYTDSVQMTINEYGVTLDIMQRIGSSSQARVVARVGMSKEHAQKFIAELEKLFLISESPLKPTSKVVN